jgi:hypothetical protein
VLLSKTPASPYPNIPLVRPLTSFRLSLSLSLCVCVCEFPYLCILRGLLRIRTTADRCL